ncbi:stage II sporulation protein M [Bacillus sp. DNRA2]|uniref:stage II sporulation protein M n=1 Tax=Bacillus sp. DNRA2 TaxID=2723053 RepID=UPI00145F4C36|nr:stage II sporulation protein M [Bacillus sp. DNRA2]NMD71251.1 stage II sporulation protein M [Bacillus sp. DNRA2]
MKKIKTEMRNELMWSKYSRKLILILLVFFFSCLWGGVFQSHKVPLPPNPPDNNWFYYFSHNMKQCLILVLVGFLTYGIGSLIILITNGVMIGIVIEMIIQNNMTQAIFTAFLPHGIFEIPAVLIACLYPFMLWSFLITAIKKRNVSPKIVKLEIIMPPLLIVILLFIAGILETKFGLSY